MADDGMLVNFDIGEGLFNVKPNFKGGKWRDRLAAKKSAQRNQRQAIQRQPRPVSVPHDSVHQEPQQSLANEGARPSKRLRVDKEQGGATRVGKPRHHQKTKLDSEPQNVISSLFTYNPPTTHLETEHPADDTAEPVQPSNAPLKSDLDTFTSLGLSEHLAAHLLQKLNIKAPTAIQRTAISQLVKENTDTFIQAETGSGKTLAYLLPIVERLLALSSRGSRHTGENGNEGLHRDSGLFAIVLAPTRELGKQISVVLEDVLRCAHWLVSGTVLGGEKKKSEKARLRKGLNILVATPGRLVDHLDNTKVLDVSNVRWLVLDEGDRLMELGFEQDIRKILEHLDSHPNGRPLVNGFPEKRTTILCSATLKSNVEKLGEMSLQDAAHIQASEGDDTRMSAGQDQNQNSFKAPAQLKQSYAIVPPKQRLVALTALLKRSFVRHGSVMKAMVFLSCADSVDFHFEVFAKREQDGAARDEPERDGESQSKEKGDVQTTSFRTSAEAHAFSGKSHSVRVFRLHGSLPQAVRTSTLRSFGRCNEPSFLICTDVASRGLDLPNVDLVVEYDPPFSKDEHLHRIGRTARAGKDGRALIFLLPGAEEGYIPILKQLHGDRSLIQNSTNDILKKGFGSAGLGGGEDWEERATVWQLDIERWALEGPKYLEMARRAYQSHVRAYATHVAAERQIFDMKEMHLGHLAKAFALRDKPASIRVPGLRPGKNSANAVRLERRARAGKAAAEGGKSARPDAADATDAQSARRKMHAKSKELSRASEFNLA